MGANLEQAFMWRVFPGKNHAKIIQLHQNIKINISIDIATLKTELVGMMGKNNQRHHPW